MNDHQREELLDNLSAFASARSSSVKLRHDLAQHKYEAEKIVRATKLVVSSERSPDGKATFPNQDSRDGEVSRRLGLDQSYQKLLATIDADGDEIAEVDATIDICRFTLDTFKVYG